MKKLFAITGICALLAAPAFAQTEKKEEAAETPPSAAEVDAAATAITGIAEDEKKAEGYCAIVKEMDALKEGDDAKAEELGQKMDTYIAGLGEEVQNAFAVAETLEPESDGAKKIDAAFGKLDEKCGA